jgi:hypothetical protein
MQHTLASCASVSGHWRRKGVHSLREAVEGFPPWERGQLARRGPSLGSLRFAPGLIWIAAAMLQLCFTTANKDWKNTASSHGPRRWAKAAAWLQQSKCVMHNFRRCRRSQLLKWLQHPDPSASPYLPVSPRKFIIDFKRAVVVLYLVNPETLLVLIMVHLKY